MNGNEQLSADTVILTDVVQLLVVVVDELIEADVVDKLLSVDNNFGLIEFDNIVGLIEVVAVDLTKVVD